MYVCSQPHTTPALPLGKVLSTNWTGGWKAQRFGLEALKKWKISWPIQATAYQPHQLHYHSYPVTVSLILNICVTVVKNCFPAATSHLGRNEITNNNINMDYRKMETMTKMILTCTLEFHPLFSYKLCACHMTGCHYVQALFHSGCAPCTNWS